MSGPFARAASVYRALGWYGTLPIVGKDVDLPTGFTGRHADFPDEQQVQRWITERGHHNIAIRLPQGVLGIDVDGYFDGQRQRVGLHTIEHFEERYGELPPTWKSSARIDGSGIYLFQVPRAIQWVSDLGRESDVQIIRYGHRYMVAPPSLHPYTSTEYSWWQPITNQITNLPPRPDQLPHLPPEWVTGLTKARGGLARDIIAGVRDPNASNDSRDSSAGQRMRREIEEQTRVDPELMLLIGAPPGEQNDRMFAYLCSLRAKNIDRDSATTLGLVAVQRMENSRPDDPWTPEHVIEMARRIWREYRPGTTIQQEIARELGSDAPTVTDAQRAWAQSVVSPTTVPNDPMVSSDPVGPSPGTSSLASSDRSVLIPEMVTLTADAAQERFEAVPEPDPVQDGAETLADGSAGVAGFEAATDLGNAERFARLYAGHRLRYIPELKSWFIWDESRWVHDIANQAYRLTAQIAADVRRTAERDADHAADWAAWANRCESERGMTAMLKIATTHESFRFPAGEMDSDPRLLTCANGVVELRDSGHVIRPARPEDAISFCTKTRYVTAESANARSTDWERLLEFIFPDERLRRYVQALCGYSLLGANPRRLWIVLLGATTTGKTTLLELISDALGDYAKSANLSILRGNQDERPRADIVRVLPARLVYMVEAEEEIYLHVDQIKRATGGDKLSARLPHAQAYVERVPAFTPFLSANSMPTITAADQALLKRMVVLPFSRVIDQDRAMVETVMRMRAHPPREAILRWMLEGWDRIQAGALDDVNSVPSEVISATMEAMDSLSPLDQFIGDWCEVGGMEWETADRLWMAYRCWCKDQSLSRWETMSQTVFGKMLSRRGYGKKRRVWVVTDHSGNNFALLQDETKLVTRDVQLVTHDVQLVTYDVNSRAQKTVYFGISIRKSEELERKLQTMRWSSGF